MDNHPIQGVFSLHALVTRVFWVLALYSTVTLTRIDHLLKMNERMKMFTIHFQM